MIEVFKTDVQKKRRSKEILTSIHLQFPYYICNFDLEDCDKILRIDSLTKDIESEEIIKLLSQHGVNAEVLQDQDHDYII